MQYINDYITGVEQDIIRSRSKLKAETEYVNKLRTKLARSKTPAGEVKVSEVLDNHLKILKSYEKDYNIALSKRPSKEMKKCFADILELEVLDEDISKKYRELNKGKKEEDRVTRTPEEELISYKISKLYLIHDFCWTPAWGEVFIEIVEGIINARNDIALDNHMRRMFRLYL